MYMHVTTDIKVHEKKLIEMQVWREEFINIAGDSNTQAESQNTGDQNSSINQLDVIDIYRLLQIKTAKLYSV